MSRLSTFLRKQRLWLPANPSPNRMTSALRERAAGDPEMPGDIAGVIAMIRRECPTFSSDDMNTPFDQLPIDSVGMLMVRTYVDEAAKTPLDHGQWDRIVTPADIVNALRSAGGGSARAEGQTADERRSYALNMPQMALCGLSESWLFKELGDMHWSMLAKGLAAPSHLLRDSSGERIYATFTRFRFVSSCPLASYQENERVEIAAKMSRYGAGIFFSETAVAGRQKSIRATLMSTFSKFGAAASNISLLKGVPDIPTGCDIPLASEFPEFGQGYRTRREQTLPAAIFECEYEIIPAYDINGVGLLYFAAYPMINDICATRYVGRAVMNGFSTLQRDVFYFGNSNLEDTLVYRLHECNITEASIEMSGSISRKSDGGMMAHVLTQKARLGQAPEPKDKVSPGESRN